MKNALIRGVAAASIAALAGAAHAELMYGTTSVGFLLSWDSATPANPISGVAISGLENNEQVVGMDFRPADNQLYALGSFGNIYTLNTFTGEATSVGAITGATLNGAAFGFDFNPVVDRIRVVSDTNQNLRLNPTVSPITATADGDLTYAAGDVNFGRDQDVSFAAYTNSFAGAGFTQLFVIDSDADVLGRLDDPNSGQITTVGGLGVDIGARGGFDFSPSTNTGWVVATPVTDSTSKLYRIDNTTGQLTLIDEIAGGLDIRTLAVVPAPGSFLVFAGAALAVARRRR
ncbi:MAG: DUF4394 domain-containing protein [Planctomycetota bacterium]|nr:DUF4394 domain-containing protein [Planctomycetota bacterium]